MNHLRSRGLWRSCVPLAIISAVAAFVLLFAPFILQKSMADSANTMVPLAGEVIEVLPDEGLLVVRLADDGKRQKFFVTEDTEFTGVFQLQEIKKKQKVKVWYSVDNEMLIALRIEVAPELGC